MKLNSYFVIVLLFAKAIISVNPGVVIRINKTNLGKIIETALPVINYFLETIPPINEFKSYTITFKEMNIKPEKLRSNQVRFLDITEEDYLKLELQDVVVHVTSRIELPCGYFNPYVGTFRLKVVVSRVVVKLSFKDFPKYAEGKPVIDFKFDFLELDQTRHEYRTTFEGNTGYLAEAIMNNLQSTIYSSLQSNLLSKEALINEIINLQISTRFNPFQFIPEWFVAFNNLFTEKPTITTEEILFKIDGTFSSQKLRILENKNQKVYQIQPHSENFVDIFISEYTLNTFIESISGTEIAFTKEQVEYDFKSLTTNPQLRIMEDGIEFDNHCIEIHSKNLGAENALVLSTHFSGLIDFFNVGSDDNGKQVDLVFRALGMSSDTTFDMKKCIAVFEKYVPFFNHLVFVSDNHYSLPIPEYEMPFNYQWSTFRLKLESGFVHIGGSVSVKENPQVQSFIVI